LPAQQQVDYAYENINISKGLKKPDWINETKPLKSNHQGR
jgi:hypothetical protein